MCSVMDNINIKDLSCPYCGNNIEWLHCRQIESVKDDVKPIDSVFLVAHYCPHCGRILLLVPIRESEAKPSQ